MLSVHLVDDRNPRNHSFCEPDWAAIKIVSERAQHSWRIATAAEEAAFRRSTKAASPRAPVAAGVAKSRATAAQAAARHGIVLRTSAAKSSKAPRDWPEALDAGYSNAQLAAFVKAGALPNPVHLKHHGVLHKYGPIVLRTLQERGFIGL